MIISHKHKFIFIKTRKTAGTSIEIALSKLCGDRDIITPISRIDEPARLAHSNRSPQNFYLPISKYTFKDYLELCKGSKKAFKNHIGAQEIRKNISSEIWDSYFKFCFERNPFDKAVSLYYWKRQSEEISLSEFLLKGGLQTIKGKELYTHDGNILIDKIYRFEDLENALIDISKKLNLKANIVMPKYRAKNSTRKDKRHYSDIISTADRKIIEHKFSWELETLEYKF